MDRPYWVQIAANFVCSGMRLVFEVKEKFWTESSAICAKVSDLAVEGDSAAIYIAVPPVRAQGKQE
jgi:hypothetical protein